MNGSILTHAYRVRVLCKDLLLLSEVIPSSSKFNLVGLKERLLRASFGYFSDSF